MLRGNWRLKNWSVKGLRQKNIVLCLSSVQVISRLQRNVNSLKEELKEAKTAVLDAQKMQARWKAMKWESPITNMRL